MVLFKRSRFQSQPAHALYFSDRPASFRVVNFILRPQLNPINHFLAIAIDGVESSQYLSSHFQLSVKIFLRKNNGKPEYAVQWFSFQI